jgi:hypothetical protein
LSPFCGLDLDEKIKGQEESKESDVEKSTIEKKIGRKVSKSE